MNSERRRLWLEGGLILLLVLLAGVPRMGWPGLTEFKADEARLTYLALQMADGTAFPLRGISSSVGVPNFPMSVWLYGLPLLLWAHVYAATIFTGLLNTLAVLGCYWLVRRYWGVQAAVVAAVMFAVSPWAIHHSRKIWAQNLLSFFVMGWAISGVLVFAERRFKWIVLHLLCLAVAVQVHFAGFALMPATLVYMVVFRRQLRWRWLGVGVGLSILTAVPFVLYLLNHRTLVGLSSAGLPGAEGLSRGWDMVVWRYAWLLTSGHESHALVGAEALPRFWARVPNLTAVHWLWTLLAIAGVALMAGTVLSGKREFVFQRVELMVVVWGVMPLLLFGLPLLPIELHYLLPIYPVPYIAAAVFWRRMVVYRLHRRQQAAVWGVLLITVGAQLWFWIQLLTFITTQVTPGTFGTPLVHQLEATMVAQRWLDKGDVAEVLIVGAGNDPEVDAFPAIYRTLFYGVPHRFVDVNKTAVFPAQPAVVLLANGAGQAGDLYRAVATEQVAVALRQGEGVLALLTIAGMGAPTPDVLFDPPPILTNWVSWRGYDMPTVSEDGMTRWQVHWYVGETAVVDYHLFNHLLGADGGRVGQADAAAFPASQWRAGDVVVSHFHLVWPNDVERVRIGMYRYPDLTPALVFDVAGNPYTDGIEIELSGD